MPYIPPRDRAMLDNGLRKPVTPGELNYRITQFILDYAGDDPTYSVYNEVVGVLECVKLELYRREIASYEDKKKEENGDVYPRRWE
ncbi:hypothetical protein LCGC14_0911920 [marine sediment metagenome]|uniref:Uncharacterized protein n=1 Tax=marine sediment metagenome TaxID=412755 RepID=A0A0F9RCB0_9ZZZZ